MICVRKPTINSTPYRAGLHYAQLYNETHLKTMLDPGLEINTNVTAVPASPVSVFRFDRRFFAAAAAIELFTILSILLTFYGWWKIGRSASLSPLEVAKVSQQHVFSLWSGED